MDRRWNLEELAQESQKYLQDDGDSRRIQWKPNGRQIRYYSTLGLLDKPHTENGRTVWYGSKHLVQLLAIKRLQQEGMKLSEIQRSLAGSTLEEMRLLVGLPHDFLKSLHDSVTKTVDSPRRERAFWAVRPSVSASNPQTGLLVSNEPTFHHLWQLELAPGVTLSLSEQQAANLSQEERAELARELAVFWRNRQQKRMENP